MNLTQHMKHVTFFMPHYRLMTTVYLLQLNGAESIFLLLIKSAKWKQIDSDVKTKIPTTGCKVNVHDQTTT